MNKNFKNMTIGAIASTIAGAYYLYGSPEGVARRKQLAAWSVKMKGDMLDGLEKLKEVSEPKYKELVKKVSEKYKNVDKGELKKAVDEMHATWNKMKRQVAAEVAKRADQIAKENKSVKGKVKVAVKKAAAKTVKVVKAKTKKVAVKTDKAPAAEVNVENK